MVLSVWEFMNAYIKICIRYVESHGFVCYSSAGSKKSEGPGTLNKVVPASVCGTCFSGSNIN